MRHLYLKRFLFSKKEYEEVTATRNLFFQDYISDTNFDRGGYSLTGVVGALPARFRTPTSTNIIAM